MQNDTQKFDLLVRSLMQDAEEPVSPRVWEGVSAGLASRKRRTFPLWLLAAGLAAAAAVVLGVVLSGTHNSNLPIHIDTVSLTEPGPEGTAPDGDGMTDSVPKSDLLADGGTSAVRDGDDGFRTGERLAHGRRDTDRTTHRQDGGLSVLPADDADGPAPERAEIPADSGAADLPQEAEVRSGDGGDFREDVRSAAALSEEPASEEVSDPFARMAWEDSRGKSSPHVSVAFGGAMESNGNPQSVGGIQMMRAPANKERTRTIIEQTGPTSAYAIPVSAGLNVRLDLGGRWAVGTGLNWTMLQRTFFGTFRKTGEEPVYADIHNTLHYVGIPVNAYYSLLQGDRIGLYAFGGGSVEKAVSNQFRASGADGLSHREGVDGVQFSAAAGLGVQFRLTRFLGLYIDPSLRYYIPGNQPKSIRTQQPLMMNFEAGLRFDL